MVEQRWLFPEDETDSDADTEGDGGGGVVARSILTRSRFGMWTLNPYVGCSHGCAFCYVRRRQQIIEEAESRRATTAGMAATVQPAWGAFVHPKVNAITRLRREIYRVGPGETIFMCSATDAYHPPEAEHRLTRRVLEMLLEWGGSRRTGMGAETGIRLMILTKNSLVTRDIDLLRRFRGVRVGMSVNTLDRRAWQCFEMNSSPPEERLEALETLRHHGISTFVFMSPAIPFVTDFETLIPALASRTLKVSAETLNLSVGNRPALVAAVRRFLPGRETEFWEAVTTRAWGNEAARRIPELCAAHGVRFGGFFRNECSPRKLVAMFGEGGVMGSGPPVEGGPR